MHYVLEGSIQRGGGRMRVNVQLVDAESGSQLWAERFDKPVADLFDMQDEIGARLAAQLQTELIDAEARRAASGVNPDATGLFTASLTITRKLDYLRAVWEDDRPCPTPSAPIADVVP